MKFPTNATPEIQANWIALQGLKLQTTQYMLDKFCEAKNKLDAADLSQITDEDKKEIDTINAQLESQQKFLADVHNEIMTAQVDDTHNQLEAAKLRLEEIERETQECHKCFEDLAPEYKGEYSNHYQDKIKELKGEELTVLAKIKELSL